MLQPKVSEIITEFLKESEENYLALRNNLSQYKNIFQYVYSNIFTEIYCSTERRGFELKSNFHIIFKTYKDKKKMEPLGKNTQNYEDIRNETYFYEQKPLKIDDFNEAEEKEVKEHVEKRKIKRREVAEKNKFEKKKKKKQEQDKKTKKELWDEMKDLNKEFKDMKEPKKKSKKMSKTILKGNFLM